MSRPTQAKGPKIDLNDKHDKSDLLGTLIVVLLKARNLNDKHSFRKSDVFAQAKLNDIQKRTHVDFKGGQHPEWDGEVRFPILKNSASKFRKMEVACYSVEPRTEDLMGKAVVDITETLRTGEFDDWVQLEVDGVARGELYLEMTYYANAPAPAAATGPSNKFLSSVIDQNTALKRRPSKFSPAERLSRPQEPAYFTPPPQDANTPIRPPFDPRKNMSRPPNTQPPRYDTPVMPGAYPQGASDIRPGISSGEANGSYNGEPAPNSTPGAQQQQPTALPSILRPGPAAPLATHPPNGAGHGRNSSDPALLPKTSPGQNPYIGGSGVSQSPPQNPYISANTPPTNPYINQAGPSVQRPTTHRPMNTGRPYAAGYNAQVDPNADYRRNGPPLMWQDYSSVTLPEGFYLDFPTPPPGATNAHPSYNRRTSGASVSPGDYGICYDPSRDDRNPVPHLQERYQSPLPLPPRSERTSSSTAQTNNPAPVTQPTREPSPPPYAPIPPAKSPSPALDQSRLNALRRAEEDAARRRQQELNDLELAMQLDRELNLAEARAAGR